MTTDCPDDGIINFTELYARRINFTRVFDLTLDWI
jgi:hypothetical protein